MFSESMAHHRTGLEPVHIEEVFMGNVVSAGVGQAPAKQAAIFAGKMLRLRHTGTGQLNQLSRPAPRVGAFRPDEAPM